MTGVLVSKSIGIVLITVLTQGTVLIATESQGQALITVEDA